MLTPLSNIHCEMFLLLLRSKVRIMMTLYKILFLHILLRISSQLRRAFAWMTLVKFAPSFTLQNFCANWTPNKRQFQCGISDNSNVDFGIVIVNALFFWTQCVIAIVNASFLQVSFRKMKVLTSHGCDGSSYHWDESWNCSLFHEFATCLLKCPNLYTTLTIDLSRSH